MIYFFFDIACILSGIILGTNLLSKQKSIGSSVTSLSYRITAYQATLGSIALILGSLLLILKPGCAIHDVVGIVAGITLLGNKLNEVPVVGDQLAQAGNWLNTYRDYIGIAAIVIGIFGLFNIHILC